MPSEAAQCAQCYGVDKSANPAAPAFEGIAIVPGLTATVLTVALQTFHQSMPNVQARDAENVIAYILSLKRTL